MFVLHQAFLSNIKSPPHDLGAGLWPKRKLVPLGQHLVIFSTYALACGNLKATLGSCSLPPPCGSWTGTHQTPLIHWASLLSSPFGKPESHHAGIIGICQHARLNFLYVCFSLFSLYVWLLSLHICLSVCCVCLVPSEVRRGCQILWNWSYRQLLAAM